MEKLEMVGLSELSHAEMQETDGGVAPIAVAVAVGTVGAAVGVMVVGAAVGYGIYKLVNWATS